jgi:hypothetical protein
LPYSTQIEPSPAVIESGALDPVGAIAKTCVIDIEADNAGDAAQKARDIQLRPDSMATVFRVVGPDGSVGEFDLAPQQIAAPPDAAPSSLQFADREHHRRALIGTRHRGPASGILAQHSFSLLAEKGKLKLSPWQSKTGEHDEPKLHYRTCGRQICTRPNVGQSF